MSKRAIISIFALLFASGLGFETIAQPSGEPVKPAPAPETPFARALIRLDDLEAQIRALTDRIERNEAEIANQKSENARLTKALEETKAAGLSSQENEPTSQAAKNETISEAMAETKAENSPTTEIATAPVTAPAPKPLAEVAPTSIVPKPSASVAAVPPPAPTSAGTVSVTQKPAPILLAEAKLQLQRSEFQAAENNLANLIAAYPTANEAIEGHWLLGETRFVQRAYNAAALSYVNYLEKAPSGPKASDALLRLSSSFREIGDNRQRCLAFKEYQRRTPNPTPVQSARAAAELAKGACN